MKVNSTYKSLILGVLLFAACDSVDYPDRFVQTSGVPTVDFIRYANKDVVITQANMEEIVYIVLTFIFSRIKSHMNKSHGHLHESAQKWNRHWGS